ncbi:histidine phosphatase family protein [Curtobacterium flaccumfaciens]|nr:histidine phosphatase family protein [Curtobacterium flaccumfaciens]
MPRTESLADVIDRVRPLWIDELLPAAANGAQVLVVAHGNSLRAMCAVIDDLTAAAVEALNIPTGQPLMYCIGGDRSIRNPHGTYLDVVAARNAVAKVAAEGGT